jgi:putative hydrolase of the HAD superfamily
MLKAVFFDMYGTLAGFEPSRFAVQSQACAQFGVQVTPEGIVKGYGAADAYMARENAVRHLRLRDPRERDLFFAEYERLVLRGSGVEVSQERALEIWRRIRKIPYNLAPFADVVPTLEAVRERGLIVGLITNMDGDGDDIARELGLEEHLDLTVTSLEAGATKPDPAIFKAALSRAGAEPAEAMHVGDQLSSDVEGAASAGLTPVLLDRDGIHRGYTAHPRIESLADLPALVDQIRDADAD